MKQKKNDRSFKAGKRNADRKQAGKPGFGTRPANAGKGVGSDSVRTAGNIARMKKREMAAAVAELFRLYPTEIFNYKRVSRQLGIKLMSQKVMISEILEDLVLDGSLHRIDRGRYRNNAIGTTDAGTFERRSNGHNSVLPDTGGAPIFVAERNSAHAMSGDKVRIQLLGKRRGAEPEAVVTEILERADRLVVGCVHMSDGFAFVITEDRTLSNDIFVPKAKLKGAENRDKVIVRIVAWPDNLKNPEGEVTAILGKAGENNTEMNAILAEYGLPYIYPREVEEFADKLPEEIPAEVIAAREDFREITTFTIDPKEAKDFDDAISFRSLPQEKYEIGVHIADVSYYVRPGDLIDDEAYTRGTSIYLVDRTVPMLPERLCNNLCSLNPNVERLAYACIFRLNDRAEVEDYRIVRTVIRSDRRFCYEEVQEVIEREEGEYAAEILTLNNLAQILRKKRFAAGAIDFESEEVRFVLDDQGHPISVYTKVSTKANQLIEEFMLLANRTVAGHVAGIRNSKGKKNTFVYRIHDQPDPEKLSNLSDFIRRFGLKLDLSTDNAELSKGINRLLNAVKGRPEQRLVDTIAIRSMAKASYSTENVGHYGLAFANYTHFTSPIRRYPDLMVHRMLTQYLPGGASFDKDEYEEKCRHCSDMEQIAANAERASIKYKQVEFMSSRIGQVFDGLISGVTEWGLYVSLTAVGCEGLVPIRFLGSDYFDYDEKNYSLIGRRTKRRFSLGDAITVRVCSANLERKQLDLEPV